MTNPSSTPNPRFLDAVRASGLVPPHHLQRALDLQSHAARRGRSLALDRILVKLELLTHDQALGLWQALRFHTWRAEDKIYCDLALDLDLLTPAMAKACLREQRRAYTDEHTLLRVNTIACQRGYLQPADDLRLVQALHQHRPATLQPASPTERLPSPRAARKGEEDAWLRRAHDDELHTFRSHLDDDP